MPRCWSTALLAVALLAFAGRPAGAAEFVDAAGRHVMLPAQISRILPAERNAEVMVFVLTPEKLAGMSRAAMLKRPVRAVLGWRPRTTPQSLAETAQQLSADLIVDAGAVTPDRAAFANEVTRLTGVPYVLLDDSFARLPRTLRSLAAILDADQRLTRDLFIYAEHAIAGLRGRLLITPASTRPRVYYALGADGLTTALPGSPAGEALDEAGAINVAAPLGRDTEVPINLPQLLAWNPEIIIAEGRRAYDALRRNSMLRGVLAVRNKRVYLEPTSPFGWIEDPSGVNRLIGLYWLSSLFYPDATSEDIRSVTCEFYDKFYRIKLTNAQIEAMVLPAGAPPPEAMRPVVEPLFGLGTTPPPTTAHPLAGAPSASPPVTAPPSIAPSTPSTGIAPGEAPLVIGAKPSDICTVPGTGGPLDLTAPPSGPGSMSAPGVPPPGRRGRPAVLLKEPSEPPHEATGSSAGDVPPPAAGSGYQYQTRP